MTSVQGPDGPRIVFSKGGGMSSTNVPLITRSLTYVLHIAGVDEPLIEFRRRRRVRGAGGGGGAALAISFIAHAVVGVTLVALCRGSYRRGDEHHESVEVDLAPRPVVEFSPTIATPTPAAFDDRASSKWAARRSSRVPRIPRATPKNAMDATEATEAPATRFLMSAGTVATPATAGSPGTAAASSGSAGGTGPVAGENDVDAPARLLASSPVVYPQAARQGAIETYLAVEIVVDVDGRVISARPLTRAGYGLDEAALHAVRAYLFSPAVRGGRAVSVRMRWTVQFRLR